MATYRELTNQYLEQTEAKDIPFQTVRTFLFELCNEVEFDIYMNNDKDVPNSVEEKFHAGMARILNYEPMNYVLGYAWFFGYKFIVNGDVLIPRYETEELVGNILNYVDDYFADYKEIKACDIGTGSGAIAISLNKEEERFSFIASDISKEAIEVAKKNAELNGLNMEFRVGDMLQPLIDTNEKVDILICNPPYIGDYEVLDTSVKDYEPNIALFGGEDGLKYYKNVFENANKILNKHSLLAFEIGYRQKDVLESLAKEAFKDAEVKTLQDINGKDRMLFILNK